MAPYAHVYEVYQKLKYACAMLKWLGHAILGNFSTDQMVIELTKI